jgi:hypothetical protein
MILVRHSVVEIYQRRKRRGELVRGDRMRSILMR